MDSFSELNRVLLRLLNSLSKLGLSAQAEFISHLIDLLHSNNRTELIRKINDVELWGGSGAIWEVDIIDPSEKEHFYSILRELVDEMENENILGKRAKLIGK